MQNTPLINYGHLEDENITRSEKFVGLHKIGEWELVFLVFHKVGQKKRAEISPQILKLSEEIERGIRN